MKTKQLIATFALLYGLHIAWCAEKPPIPGLVPVKKPAWERSEQRVIPLKREDASPLVVGIDMHKRVWIANHADNLLVAFDEKGDKDSEIHVSSRGFVSTIDDDGKQLVMAYEQRTQPGWPQAEVEIFDIGRGRGREDVRKARWRLPGFWRSASIRNRVLQLQAEGGLPPFLRSDAVRRHAAAMTDRGVVYVTVPLFNSIEKYRRTGRIMAKYTCDDVQPFTPLWITALGDDTICVGDAAQNRIIFFDQNARVQKEIPFEDIEGAIVAPCYEEQCAVYNPVKRTLSEWNKDGELIRTTPLYVENVTSLAMPDDETVWVFSAEAWQWTEYTYAK